MNDWIRCEDKLPSENGDYLVTTISCVGNKKPYVKIMSFAKDLYRTNENDFADMAGLSGWYGYSSEYGYYIVTSVRAWQPLPEAYKGE